MRTMRDPMKSEYVAVLRGDPVLLNRITPVVDQRRHLWQRLEIFWQVRARKKRIYIKIFTHRHLWDIPRGRFVRKGDIEKEKKEKKNGKHSALVLIQVMFDNS